MDRIDFMVKRGQLIGIIGKVGSGKSSLLASILGELNKVSGMVAICLHFSSRNTKKNYKVQIDIFFTKNITIYFQATQLLNGLTVVLDSCNKNLGCKKDLLEITSYLANCTKVTGTKQLLRLVL